MYLVFDIGGTKTRIGITSSPQKIDKIRIFKTPSHPEEAFLLIKKQAFSLSKGKPIKKISGGIAGVLNQGKNRLVSSPHLSLWINKPLKKKLEKDFSCPALLNNDADLAGLGEAYFGAGKGKKIIAYLTISTGIGGTRIVDGKIDKNFWGFEPGHQLIGKEGLDWEEELSGSAFLRKYNQKAETIPRGDQRWQEAARLLAYGLHNVLVFWSPEIVILGGSLTKRIPLNTTKKELSKIIKIFPKIPDIKKSKLGDLNGLYGGLITLSNNFR